MITVRKQKNPYGLSVEGHAGAEKNDQGHDLVCAAVSTLMHTLRYSLCKQYVEHACEEEDGHMEIRMQRDKDFDRETAQTFLVIEQGLEMLERAYPEHIKIM